MSDMTVALLIRGDGKDARRAALDAKSGLQEMGKAGKGAGDMVKIAAVEQTAAIRASATKATEAMTTVKRAGKGAGAAIKEAMSEGVREQRRVGDEAERLGERIKRSMRRIADNGGVFRILARTAMSEFGRIKSFMSTTLGMVAGAGAGMLIGREIRNSAQLDRTLLRTRQTAGMTSEQQEELRGMYWQMAKANGNDMGELSGGFDKLIASGLSYDASKATIGAIDKGTAITGADSTVLAQGLLTGANAYGFDLAESGQALEMLEKMIVAGRAGNAELENLADIFARVGPAARRGGMGFDQSLAMIETLSKLESQPERLATLAESTTRLFTNRNYMVAAAKGSGVRFFNKDGSRRDMLDVLDEMKVKYDKLTTDKQRMNFISKAFGKTDLDTQKGIQFLLSDTALKDMRQTQTEIGGAKGTVAKDLEENRNTPTAVATRMRNTLQETMDRMSQPINKAFADAGSYLLDDLNLSGSQLLAAGAGTAVAGHYAGRVGGVAMDKFATWVNGGLDTMKNITVGKALKEATGVMPVYVTNWSGAPQSGTGTPIGGVGGGKGAGKSSPLVPRGVLPVGGNMIGMPIPLSGVENSDTARLLGINEQQLQHAETIKTPGIKGWFYNSERQRYIEQARNANEGRVSMPAIGGFYQKMMAPALSPALMPGGSASNAQSSRELTDAARAITAASRSMEEFCKRPLNVNVHSDMPMMHAEFGRVMERDARRG